MKIGDILNALERFAPLAFQESYDNSGLQVGLTKVEATGVLLCLDVTEEVIDEAISLGYNLIISHHPLIFKPIKNITYNSYIDKCIVKAIKNNITIYSAHTNLDNIIRGVNYSIADELELKSLHVLRPQTDVMMQLVTFVPIQSLEKVRTALFNIGAGRLGDYDSCSFVLQGLGTYKAQEHAHPYIGEIGELHTEDEVRLEMVFFSHMKDKVIETLLENHPYEMPAYDLHKIYSKTDEIGSGLIGEISEPINAEQFILKLKKIFNAKKIAYSGDINKTIKKIAVCGGSGAFLIEDAIKKSADIFITGEIKYHEMAGYNDKIILLEFGHYESEQYTQKLLLKYINKEFPNCKIRTTSINTNFKKYF